MYKKVQKALAVIGGLGFIALFVTFTRLSDESNVLMAAGNEKRIKLPRIPIEIKKDWDVGEIAFETEKTEKLGYVVWARAQNKEMITPCYLGAYYLVSKRTVTGLEGEGLKVSRYIQTAIDSENYLTPHAKEFRDYFLIFEPNKKVCAGGIFVQKREMQLRERLWESVSNSITI